MLISLMPPNRLYDKFPLHPSYSMGKNWPKEALNDFHILMTENSILSLNPEEFLGKPAQTPNIRLRRYRNSEELISPPALKHSRRCGTANSEIVQNFRSGKVDCNIWDQSLGVMADEGHRAAGRMPSDNQQ